MNHDMLVLDACQLRVDTHTHTHTHADKLKPWLQNHYVQILFSFFSTQDKHNDNRGPGNLVTAIWVIIERLRNSGIIQ